MTTKLADAVIDALDGAPVWSVGGGVTIPMGSLERLRVAQALKPLLARLEAAENVCLMVGWAGRSNVEPSERAKATLALWSGWAALPGVTTDPDDNLHLNDRIITRLAQTRDEALTAALARIQEAHA